MLFDRIGVLFGHLPLLKLREARAETLLGFKKQRSLGNPSNRFTHNIIPRHSTISLCRQSCQSSEISLELSMRRQFKCFFIFDEKRLKARLLFTRAEP